MERKPVYFAAQTLAILLDGYVFNKRIFLNSSMEADYILLFSRNLDSQFNAQDILIAAWTTTSSHQVIIPSSEGTFTFTNYLGNENGTISSSNGSLVITLTDSPTYIVPTSPNQCLQLIAAITRLPHEIILDSIYIEVEIEIFNPLEISASYSISNNNPITIAPGEIEVSQVPFIYNGLSNFQTTIFVPVQIFGFPRFFMRTEFVREYQVSILPLPLPISGSFINVLIESSIELNGTLRIDNSTGRCCAAQSVPFSLIERNASQITVPLFAGPQNNTFTAEFSIQNMEGETLAYFPYTRFETLPKLTSSNFTITRAGNANVSIDINVAQIAPSEGPPSPNVTVFMLNYTKDEGYRFLQVLPIGASPIIRSTSIARIGFWVYVEKAGVRIHFVLVYI